MGGSVGLSGGERPGDVRGTMVPGTVNTNVQIQNPNIETNPNDQIPISNNPSKLKPFVSDGANSDSFVSMSGTVPGTGADTVPGKVNPGVFIDVAGAEREKAAAHDVAWMLIERAAKQDYDEAKQTLGMAGLIFTRFGYADEAAACERQVVRRAEAAGRKDDAAFLQGLAAMRAGKVDEVKKHLAAVPEVYAGREVLAEYVKRHDQLVRMSPAFTAARSIADIKLSRMRERDLFGKADIKARGEELSRLFTAWEARLTSGTFDSTGAILKDIWQKEPTSRGAMLLLSGYESGSQSAKTALAQDYDQACASDGVAHEFVLTDLVRIESNINTNDFGARLDQIKSQGDGRFDEKLVAQEFATLAQIYRDTPKFKSHAVEIEKRAEIADDLAKDFILPAAAGEYLGAAALSRISPWLARAIARLPLGNVGKAGAERLGGEAVQVGVSSGVFTGLNAATAFIDAPLAEHPNKAFRKEWGALATCMTFAHLLHVPLGRIRQHMGKAKFLSDPKASPVIVNGLKLPALSPFGRVAYGLIDHAAQTAGFYTGAKVGERMGLRDTPPNLFQEWKKLLMFQIGGRMANGMSGGRLDRMAAEAKARPYIEASQRIAERLGKDMGKGANAFSEAIYLSYVRGDIGGWQLIGVSDALSGKAKKGDSIDTVLKTNELLANAGITADNKVPLFDGRKLRLVTPVAREAYIKELQQQRARNAEAAAPVPAYVIACEVDGSGNGPHPGSASKRAAEGNGDGVTESQTRPAEESGDSTNVGAKGPLEEGDSVGHHIGWFSGEILSALRSAAPSIGRIKGFLYWLLTVTRTIEEESIPKDLHVQYMTRVPEVPLSPNVKAKHAIAWNHFYFTDIERPGRAVVGTPDNFAKVTFKEYFSLKAGVDDLDALRDVTNNLIGKIPVLMKGLHEIALKNNDSIECKVPSTLTGFLEHPDTIVIHYYRRETKAQIRQLVDELFPDQQDRGLRVKSGFDFSYGDLSSGKEKTSSHSELVAWMLASELYKNRDTILSNYDEESFARRSAERIQYWNAADVHEVFVQFVNARQLDQQMNP